MGTCFGNTTINDNFVLQRTNSQSTNLTGSCSSDFSSFQKSVAKRSQLLNKRSHIAFFHENPQLKPLLDNNLYIKRKPDTSNLIRSLEQINEDIPSNIENRPQSSTQPQIKVNDAHNKIGRFGPKKQKISPNLNQKFF